MRTLVRGLNIVIAVLASCVLGLALYGVLRPPAVTQAAHPEELIQSSAEGIPDEEDLEGDPWQQGTQLADQGDWGEAVDYLENALEQSPETPERYLLLAQAYRQTERDNDAAQVLRRGMETTGAKELELPLKAAESTLDIPEDQRARLNALYAAFEAGEDTALSEAIQNWGNGQIIPDDAGNYTHNPLWVKTGNLAWDGERFWASYTGTGLLLYGMGIFYGTISEGVPDGPGSCITVDTWYPDGAVSYLRLDGQWDGGTAVGEVEFRNRCTNAADAFSEYDMTATLDGTASEMITYGKVMIDFYGDDTVHTFLLSIQDGALSQSAFSGSVVHCSAHSGCRATLSALEDSFLKTYQNPYPWAKESPYEDPWAFLNFSYGY